MILETIQQSKLLENRVDDLRMAIFNHQEKENDSRAKLLGNFSILCGEKNLSNLSVSNCENWTAIAFRPKQKVGIDLEKLVEVKNYLQIAKDFFHQDEYNLIKNSENSAHLFTAVWTVKESWFKINNSGIGALPGINLSEWLICDMKPEFIDFKKYQLIHKNFRLGQKIFYLSVITTS